MFGSKIISLTLLLAVVAAAHGTVLGADPPDLPGFASNAGADMDRIYKAMKITNVRTVGEPYAPGDTVAIAYEIANTSDTALNVPVNHTYSRPFHLIGSRQHWIERQGGESRIPAISPRARRRGRQYAAGGSIIHAEPILAAGERLHFTQQVSTTGYPAGKYTYYTEYRQLGGRVIQTEKIDFELTAANSTANARPLEKVEGGNGFHLDGTADLKGIALGNMRKGPLMAELMTKEEMALTGVSRLSATEKAALEKWIGKLLYFTAFRVSRDAAQGLNQRAARGPHKIYHYRLPAAPSMLSEEPAIEHARMTFAKEGNRLEEWKLTRADNPPSEAPDGTADKYFDRFSFRPTEGRVHFTNGKQTRTVQVRLEDQWVVCWMFVGT
ncbi:MAG: hypothetical protein HQ581_12475 [Planctomycetes bacterium]|nr:hypothetical protein [Planctomycetota bacterium]